MSRYLAPFLLAAAAAAQIPYGHLAFVHGLPSAANDTMGIIDPNRGLVTAILRSPASISPSGTRSLALDPRQPDLIYSIRDASFLGFVMPTYLLFGNEYIGGQLNANLGAPGTPIRLRWAVGYGLLLLGSGGQLNRMFLRDMSTGLVTPQPTPTLLPDFATDLTYLGGKAYATSAGNGSPTATGTIVEWDLVANVDRVLGTGYPRLTAMTTFAGQLLVGDDAGALHLVDPSTGVMAPFVAPNVGAIRSIAVDAGQRVFVVAENGSTWSIHDLQAPQPPLHSSSSRIDDLIVGPTAVPTMQLFGAGCMGSLGQTPRLAFGAAPALGTTFDVRLSGGPAAAPVILAVGSSRQRDGAIALPRDLTPAGMPGCTQYCDVIGTRFTLSSNVLTAAVSFTLPTNPAFAGLAIPMQWYCLDANANAIGVTASNGGEAYVR